MMTEENSSPFSIFFLLVWSPLPFLFLLRGEMVSGLFLSGSKVCTELITNNAAAALAVPIALSIAKELEVRLNHI